MDFDKESLPTAIGELFQLNDHEVAYGREIHGAEIDIIATSIANPFAPTLYIEATIEYVDVQKYGKDSTKFILLREKNPACVCIIVSSSGFTPSVMERAKESRIFTLTYDELFAQFEKFAPYIDKIVNSSENATFLSSYEQPYLREGSIEHPAVEWLEEWQSKPDGPNNWLIVLGEYGTGKTALTRVLQYRWTSAYKTDPHRPIPLRIELKSFTRQFDGRALLHHFLDSNGLSHLPVDFVVHLMRKGRVILLLDGYDEMAQFLNFRERRACLAALAELSSYGAKGILTSRPNYFTESEELKIFEALYDNLAKSRMYLGRSDQEYLDKELAVDALVEKYILDRFERNLKDLTAAQTESLIKRKISDDPAGQLVVLNLLRRVFREEIGGERTSLSGKPVIITYLLELIDDLKQSAEVGVELLTEWAIYRMILDRLMLRDQQRADIDPIRRRQALRSLALSLSKRNAGTADEKAFYDIIDRDFKADLRRLSAEERHLRREQIFEDLRSSSTLTRTPVAGGTGWAFSHNSLREYLCAEHFIEALNHKSTSEISIPITDAMRSFVASMHKADLFDAVTELENIWATRHTQPKIGMYLTLLWDGIAHIQDRFSENLPFFNKTHNNSLDGVAISDISFDDFHELTIDASYSELVRVSFKGVDFRFAKFYHAIIDGCNFSECNLSNANMQSALIFECNFDGCNMYGCDFRGADESASFFARDVNGALALFSGKAAIGYLKYHGAITDPVEDNFVFRNHPGYAILTKICDRLYNQRNSQYLGLTQRGESKKNPPFARGFVDSLVRSGLADKDKNELVSLSTSGRDILGAFIEKNKFPTLFSEYLSTNSI